MTLEQFLKQRRESLGLTQADIARVINCDTAQYISNNERGMSYYADKHFRVLSKYLKVPLREMIRMRARDVEVKLCKKLGVNL
jgi:transcriptional regulator with XRE-family HTH domain